MLKLTKTVLALSSMVCVAMAASVFAEEGPYTTFNVKLQSDPAQNIISPVAESEITKDQVAFKIFNNTGEHAYLMAGDQKYYIPMVSQNTVTVPYTNEEYKVVDEDGNTIASWHIQDGKTAMMASSSSSATKAKYDTWGQQIQSLIRSNQVVATAPYQQPQSSQTTPSTEEGGTVRGYW